MLETVPPSEPQAKIRPFSPAARRRRNREEMTRAILKIARAIMRQEGAAALNLNEVARRIGIKPPSLYEYFPGGKMQIYDALFRLGMQIYAERVAPLSQRSDWVDYLRGAMETYMQFARDFPELYQICFERPVPGFEPSPESLQLSLATYQAGVQEVNRRLEAGDLQPEPGLTPQQVVDLAIGMLHGLTSQHMANEPHLPVGQGRFGSLIPAAVAIFEKAWSPKKRAV
jgi:AcrR family transcriptional regulator